MSTGHILLLGAIAGGTIFLGLPMARLQALGPAARAGLSALATGILLFLLWDVLSGAVSPIEHRLEVRHWGSFAGYAALGVGGFVLGLMSLVYYAEWMKTRANRRATTLVGPGAAATDEFRQRGSIEALTPGMRLALLIAVGIGVHNFAEGLAIGQAAAADQASLAVTLIVGFSLHNATEGFGICGPMSGEGTRPSWGFPALLGVEAGLVEPGELLGHTARNVVNAVDLDHRVVGAFRHDHVAEHEEVGHACDPFEKIPLAVGVEVVHREHRHDELKGALGQRVL